METLTAEQIQAWRSLGWKCEDMFTEKARIELQILCDMADRCRQALEAQTLLNGLGDG